ncbi:ATP-dependent DNA helicase [Shewanella sp. NIFS-20-20]|uniref:ATP-dependent DNA helicase n=1 Tax=Shewanella sp. NIFS-20-20 TaxID=2853806 RepID=UPI001C4796D2|nr:ATP-dependent DNA helicase [Shewanella sp. NIFS-20-20]MBV7314404.1 ATP-dependent DNA helicase [Shewanella sp. NIFS-20-20]
MRLSLVETTNHLFGEHGQLSQHIPGYQCRPQQQSMAQAVADTLSNGPHLLVEAGTGVGKTFAYLGPILLSGQRVIISTGTKNLQEQLVYKDLPALSKILDKPLDIALLKGRSNYLCQWLLVEQLQASSSLDPQVLDDLLRVHQWQSSSLDGDLDNLQWVAEHSPALDLVRSRKEGCQGQACDYYQACFTRKARLKASEAKLVVVNHHLLLADQQGLQQEVESFLPNVDAVVLDEVHQLPDLLARHFATVFSQSRCQSLLNRLASMAAQQLADTHALANAVARASQCLAALHQDIQALAQQRASSNWREYLSHRAISQHLWQLQQALLTLQQLLEALLVTAPELAPIIDSLSEHVSQLTVFIDADDPQSAYVIEGANDQQRHPLSLHQIPWQLGLRFQGLMQEQHGQACRWIMTSASLQLRGSLTEFAQYLGFSGHYAKQLRQLVLDSPFDYYQQALLCVPRQLRDVRHHQAVDQLLNICQRAITAADGRTFVLFTSHAMLNQVAQRLPRLVSQPVLIQGQGSKRALLDKFRQLGNAVLLGSYSFWEGVDVKGRQLSCVIIDKLPFTPPDDPMFAMKSLQVQLNGGDAFTQLAVPMAAMKLTQGVGRLIRDSRDRGVLILCDNRIVQRPYGGDLLQALPPMRRTRDLEQALAMLASI